MLCAGLVVQFGIIPDWQKPVFYRFEDFIWQGDCWKVWFAVGGGRFLTRVWESLETDMVV
jgi:hypothetical protein